MNDPFFFNYNSHVGQYKWQQFFLLRGKKCAFRGRQYSIKRKIHSTSTEIYTSGNAFKIFIPIISAELSNQ